MKLIIDDIGNKILLRNKNAEILYNYVVNNFDTKNDKSYMSKLFHIFRVAEACINVGIKLGIDKNLAYNVGLLHDFARFYQWKTFNSFSDHTTIDHADVSAKLLFEEGEIKKFTVNKKDYELLSIAIQNHNKKTINLNQLKSCKNINYEKLLTLCKLIRDCDKIDIIYKYGIGDINFNYKIPGVSSEVIESIKHHKCVDKKNIKTSTDALLTALAYLFDFNFKETLSYINFDEFFKGIEKFYCVKLGNEEKPIVEENIIIIKNYIDAVLNSKKEIQLIN